MSSGGYSQPSYSSGKGGSGMGAGYGYGNPWGRGAGSMNGSRYGFANPQGYQPPGAQSASQSPYGLWGLNVTNDPAFRSPMPWVQNPSTQMAQPLPYQPPTQNPMGRDMGGPSVGGMSNVTTGPMDFGPQSPIQGGMASNPLLASYFASSGVSPSQFASRDQQLQNDINNGIYGNNWMNPGFGPGGR